MTYEIISVVCGGEGPQLPSPPPYPDSLIFPALPEITLLDNRANLKSPCQWYEDARLDSTADILIYIHDDVAIYDPLWLDKVLSLFSNPLCAVVGLGGALSLGRESLYKLPYRISDMSRGDYASNQRDWPVHGTHLTGVRRVAVVDAFFIAVRRAFLDEVGGWPVAHLSHHGGDLWLACEAARQGKETWAVGIDCMHFGGGTSTKPVYRDAKWLQGGGLVSDHEIPHRFLYNSYRDVLPIEVPR